MGDRSVKQGALRKGSLTAADCLEVFSVLEASQVVRDVHRRLRLIGVLALDELKESLTRDLQGDFDLSWGSISVNVLTV
jgi:hypothetical protein